MRRNIKLTGRKDIPLNSFKMTSAREGSEVEFDIVKKSVFESMEPTARIYLQLTENKMTETLDFGTVESPSLSHAAKTNAFRAPSAQLRIVSTERPDTGRVLGSTNRWTLSMRSGEEDQTSKRSILLFQPKDIKPRSWKLEIRDDEHPVLYVDDSLPQPTDWARRDITFRTSVMPIVVERVMHHIIADPDIRDFPWVEEWFEWADELLPEPKRPINGEVGERDEWVDLLVDEFCRKYRFHELLLSALDRGAEK